MEMVIDWATLKSFANDRSLTLQYVDVKGSYWIKAFDGPFVVSTVIDKVSPASSDQSDFETNFKPSANTSFTDGKNNQIFKPSGFNNSGGFRFRGTGIAGTATKDTTTNIDYELTEARYINGVELLLKDHVFGDSVKFQVVDVDGTYYPAGTVLDEFGTDWYVDPDLCKQGTIRIEYPASIVTGLYIRIIYDSVGTVNDVDLKANLFLHKPPS